MVPDTQLGELDLPGSSESDSFAPVGSRFIAIVGDSIVVAGADRYSFQFSEPGKWISWPTENIRYVERDGGPITGLGTLGQTLLVFKRDSTEIWGIQGSAIPFTRRQKMDKGLLAPDALVKIGQSYIALDENRELFKLGAEELAPIVGNRDWFLDLPRPESVYAIHFPLERRVRYYSKDSETVLVYDYQNNIFTKESHVNEREEQGMVPILCGAPYKAKMLVGIRGKRDLYEWSHDYADDSGAAIRVTRKLRVQLSPFGNSARVNRVRIRLKRTTPRSTSYLKPPFITVRWSLDEVCFNQEELYLVQDCDGPYVDLCVLGVGRELIMEIIEADTEEYMLTHAFVTAQDLGR